MHVLRPLALLAVVSISVASCSAIFDYTGDDPGGEGGAVGMGGNAGPGPGAGGATPECTADLDCADISSCTDDVCDGGVCTNAARPDGTECQSGGGEDGLCEEGTCVVACSDADVTVCDDLNPCTIDSCNIDIGRCENAPVADGPLGDEQVAGDCQSIVCAAGVRATIDDDTDINDDDNPCTDDLCQAGVPSNVNRPDGTSCGAMLTCDGMGNCRGCGQPSDCPQPSVTSCATATCTNEQCGFDFVTAGTPVPPSEQTNVPCREVQCDGAGNATTVTLGNGTPCEDGLFCNGSDSCLGGNCSQHVNAPCSNAACNNFCNENTNTCGNAPQGTSCDDGQYCTQVDTCNGNGVCVGSGDPCSGQNFADSDCEGTCDEGANDCGGPEPAGSACNDGQFCTQTDTCNSSGVCVGSGDPCSGADGDGDCTESCDETNNNCNGPDPVGSNCNDGVFCTATSSCNASGQCVGSGTTFCGQCQFCDAGMDACINRPAGTPCLGGCNAMCNASGTCIDPGGQCF
ncbi:MAG: hypothetical protein AAF928_13465 [Myxococcota bacterium]